jgi:nitrogen fixation protein FixH
MRGSHDTGEVAFKLNQKGEYLLPVDIMMPGDWDVRLIFRKDDTIIHRASITFDV